MALLVASRALRSALALAPLGGVQALCARGLVLQAPARPRVIYPPVTIAGYRPTHRRELSDDEFGALPPELQRVFGFDCMSGEERRRAEMKNALESFRRHGRDTGSSEVQIALYTVRINALSEHVKKNAHDYATFRRMKMLVNSRRRLMMYLRRTDMDRYAFVVRSLNLRDVGPHLPIRNYNFAGTHRKQPKVAR